MNPIYRTNFKSVGLLMITLSTALLTIGCNTTTKESQLQPASQPIAKQLSKPSLTYMSNANEIGAINARNPEAWITVAKKNYEAKRYPRALRAANEALSINDQMTEARQIAMLSVVKVMENNIDAYHDAALMNSADKATFKETLTNITTLTSISN